MTKRGKKSWYLKRLWNHLTYKRIIEKCQNRIEFALKMFNVRDPRIRTYKIHNTLLPSCKALLNYARKWLKYMLLPLLGLVKDKLDSNQTADSATV